MKTLYAFHVLLNLIKKWGCKMNKALEILEDLKERETRWESTPFHEFEYNEAIAELEAMVQPKTCESCEYCGEDCAVLEMLMSQFGFEVESCTCPNHKLKQHTKDQQ